MSEITKNIFSLQEKIRKAEQDFSRQPGSVKLIAVSKTKPVELIEEACLAGQTDFAENYLQEAILKIEAMNRKQKTTSEKIIWHFIGTIQSNKAKTIANYFDWVHSVDSQKIAERLSKYRHAELSPLNICLQVNVDNEINKSGIDFAEIISLAKKIANLPNIKLRGLMCIPQSHKNFDEQRQSFHKMQAAFLLLQSEGFSLDTLSMGMTNDFIAAIAEGSTMVRIGSAIFGQRNR